VELVQFSLHFLEFSILALVEGGISQSLGEFRLLGFEFLDFSRKLFQFLLFAKEELATLLRLAGLG